MQTTKTKQELYNEITENMSDIFQKKNHDYGDSFEKTWDIFGFDSALVRINDKINRLNTLRNQSALVQESIEDTLIDLANYCILSVIEMKQRNNN